MDTAEQARDRLERERASEQANGVLLLFMNYRAAGSRLVLMLLKCHLYELYSRVKGSADGCMQLRLQVQTNTEVALDRRQRA